MKLHALCTLHALKHCCCCYVLSVQESWEQFSLFIAAMLCSIQHTLTNLHNASTKHDQMLSIVALQSYGDDDYLIFDCPGQIELYSHATVFRTFVDWMRGQGWSMCAVYCLDCQFVSETPKFIAGSLQALAAMVQLELPHVNVLTKVDLVADKVCFQSFLT